MNIAKTIMSAAPAKKRRPNESHFARDRANPIMSAPNVVCMLDRDGATALHVPEAGRADRAADGAHPEDGEEERCRTLMSARKTSFAKTGRDVRSGNAQRLPMNERPMSPRSDRSPMHGREAGLQVVEDAPARGAGRRPALQGEEGDDDGEEREPVQAEACGCAELVERGAREDGADDAREVELDRVQGDGVWEVLLVDERRDERLIGRASEGLREAHDDREDEDHPDLDAAREDEAREEERRRELDDLRGQQDPTPVHPVGENTAEEGEGEERCVLEDSGEAQKGRLARDRQDEPALRDRLHPRPAARRERARPQEAKVPVRERLENASQPLTHDAGA